MSISLGPGFPVAAQTLDPESARQVWAFVTRFMENPAHPSHQLERPTRAQSKDIWAARVNSKVRAILYKEDDRWHFLHVDRHDEAYRWAERHRAEHHAVTGELQIVPIRQVTFDAGEANSESAPDPDLQHQKSRLLGGHPTPGIFASRSDEYLFSLGVPRDWLPAVREVCCEEDLLHLWSSLPAEVGDRLLELADGRFVAPPAPVVQRELLAETAAGRPGFFVFDDNEDFRRLLDQPLATWIAFLHPSQQRLATCSVNGPLKITGTAGTGKTTVALHRARHLARQGRRVLLTTFVATLCENLDRSLDGFCSPAERARLTVRTVHAQARALLRQGRVFVEPINDADARALLRKIAPEGAPPLSWPELALEWEAIILAHGIATLEEYLAASRAGRGKALTARDRASIWPIFKQLRLQLERERRCPWPELCQRARELIQMQRAASPYDAVIVDEVQDLKPQELLFLDALAGEGSDRLTLVGDGGQRIFQRAFSLRSLGIDVRGRSHILRLSYRTTEQIRRFAERVARPSGDDLDGGQEDRKRTISVYHGPRPELRGFPNRDAQLNFVAERIQALLDDSLAADEIAVFTHNNRQLEPIEARLRLAGIPVFRLGSGEPCAVAAVQLGTMHRAKGLEFKAVFAVNVSRDVIPGRHYPEETADEPARLDALERERNLLYVTLTRARDHVTVTWAGAPSAFLEGMV